MIKAEKNESITHFGESKKIGLLHQPDFKKIIYFNGDKKESIDVSEMSAKEIANWIESKRRDAR